MLSTYFSTSHCDVLKYNHNYNANQSQSSQKLPKTVLIFNSTVFCISHCMLLQKRKTLPEIHPLSDLKLQKLHTDVHCHRAENCNAYEY